MSSVRNLCWGCVLTSDIRSSHSVWTLVEPTADFSPKGVEGNVSLAHESGLDLVFTESREILKAHTHTKRHIIEAAFCFLPTHLSCSQ